MNTTHKLPGLRISAPIIRIDAPNFAPRTWPPEPDAPVMIDADGRVISRYGDLFWNLSAWIGKSVLLTFHGSKGGLISPDNIELRRRIAAWWLWGPGAVRTASTLVYRHENLRVLFAVCTAEGICASDLWKYPKVIDKVGASLSTSPSSTLAVLHELWVVREDIGFTILDEDGLKRLSDAIQPRESTQTAYIPPRLWTYQLARLRGCLDDYRAHQDQIEQCYRFCLNAYALNAKSAGLSSPRGLKNSLQPFKPSNYGITAVTGRAFHGPFRDTAERFGIANLLDRWVNTSAQSGIKALSSYLSLVTHAGLAYCLNFSLMRVEEGSGLRSNCLSIERDPHGDDIYLLGGVTTKTVHDDEAFWIVSPSAEVGVAAMKSVASLRMEATAFDPERRASNDERLNPYLLSWVYEPWSSSIKRAAFKTCIAYSQVMHDWPKLFDVEQLRITSSDLALANQITMGLDPERFAVGKVWPLAWHQLRRTGAVNMLSTGLVSDASLQYQLKHASRAMTRYYGQNYYRIGSQLDADTKGMYLREMYRTLAREFQELKSDRFISPHGQKRKEQILHFISTKDHNGLARDAAAGRVRYQCTFLGGCGNPGDPCDRGGISNISGCMGSGGERPCVDVLIDREKRSVIDAVAKDARTRAAEAPSDSPLQNSLLADAESAERALDVIDEV